HVALSSRGLIDQHDDYFRSQPVSPVKCEISWLTGAMRMHRKALGSTSAPLSRGYTSASVVTALPLNANYAILLAFSSG
ncbi:hypothetical protein, partial [Escherichia coli]|uniref:hypothetical protein n=1 Tax=Escherichia coli TaxID=562 RepID=UPI001BDD5A63